MRKRWIKRDIDIWWDRFHTTADSLHVFSAETRLSFWMLRSICLLLITTPASASHIRRSSISASSVCCPVNVVMSESNGVQASSLIELTCRGSAKIAG